MRNALHYLALLTLLHDRSIGACIDKTSDLDAACDEVASPRASDTQSSLLQMARHTDRTPAAKQNRTRTLQLGIDDIFLYDHLPKAGGSFVKGVLSAGTVVPLNRLRIMHESQTLSSEDRQSTFTVGAIRNPCDYYLSCWAYFSQMPLEYRNPFGLGPEYYGVSDDLSTSEDVRRFGQWLQSSIPDSRGPGLLTARVLWSYFNESVGFAARPEPDMRGWLEKDRKVYANAADSFDPASIDCWVKTETLTSDLTKCLERFQERAGPGIVNWSAYQTLVAQLTAEHDLHTLKSSGYANVWTKKSSHQPCVFYFDKSLSNFVYNADREVFSKFGYSKCCSSLEQADDT